MCAEVKHISHRSIRLPVRIFRPTHLVHEAGDKETEKTIDVQHIMQSEQKANFAVIIIVHNFDLMTELSGIAEFVFIKSLFRVCVCVRGRCASTQCSS